MEEKYNGWTNYETWLFNVNITNEQDLYDEIKRIAKECGDSTTSFKEAMEELFYSEEQDLFIVFDRWLERNWQEINFYEILKDLQVE